VDVTGDTLALGSHRGWLNALRILCLAIGQATGEEEVKYRDREKAVIPYLDSADFYSNAGTEIGHMITEEAKK
jgi:hypothetical protein